MKTNMQKIIIIPTAKNIEKQYQYLVKEIGPNMVTTRLSLYWDTLFKLNDNEYKKDFSMEQLEILKNAKMIKIKIYEVDI